MEFATTMKMDLLTKAVNVLSDSKILNTGYNGCISKEFFNDAVAGLDKYIDVLNQLKCNFDILHPILNVNNLEFNIPVSYPANNIMNFNFIQCFVWKFKYTDLKLPSHYLDPWCEYM